MGSGELAQVIAKEEVRAIVTAMEVENGRR